MSRSTKTSPRSGKKNQRFSFSSDFEKEAPPRTLLKVSNRQNFRLLARVTLFNSRNSCVFIKNGAPEIYNHMSSFKSKGARIDEVPFSHLIKTAPN